MEISKQLLYKNLHFLAIEQLAEEYKNNGYSIEKEKKIGKFRADLVAVKGEDKIVIEVKAGRMNATRKKQLAQLADYVNSLGEYKFKVVIAFPPKDKNIQIADFEDILCNHLIEDMPSELDELSTHTTIEMISDAEIHHLLVHSGNEINVIGRGIVEVRLKYGSDGDEKGGDGHFQHESFPFSFDLYLSYNSNKELQINEGANIDINTDSFY